MMQGQVEHNAAHQQWIQFGIVVSTLGAVLCLIGLYPGVTGVEPQVGIGVLQIMIILLGMTLIISGAVLFVKIGFYPQMRHNLTQRIAIRLSLSGLLFAAAAGLADVLGYGSNPTGGIDDFPILGTYQAWGMVIGFLIAALGVFIFAVGVPLEATLFSSRSPQPVQEIEGDSPPDSA